MFLILYLQSVSKVFKGEYSGVDKSDEVEEPCSERCASLLANGTVTDELGSACAVHLFGLGVSSWLEVLEEVFVPR